MKNGVNCYLMFTSARAAQPMAPAQLPKLASSCNQKFYFLPDRPLNLGWAGHGAMGSGPPA